MNYRELRDYLNRLDESKLDLPVKINEYDIAICSAFDFRGIEPFSPGDQISYRGEPFPGHEGIFRSDRSSECAELVGIFNDRDFATVRVNSPVNPEQKSLVNWWIRNIRGAF